MKSRARLTAWSRRTISRLNRNIVQHKVLQWPFRVLAKTRLATGRVTTDAVTVVIVNWNSRDFLDVALGAIDRYSPDGTRVIVVDNHSRDGSREVVRHRSGVSWVGLPGNVGHGVAMDIGFLYAHTEYVVALDVDAFPISDQWLERLVSPLRDGYAVSGAHVRNGFVHPCCLAMRLDNFVTSNHTFVPNHSATFAADASDHNARGWDTGWEISLREHKRFLFERTEVFGPGDVGSIWDGLIYHNFYSTRFRSTKLPPAAIELELGVSEDAAEQAWSKAVERFLPRGEQH